MDCLSGRVNPQGEASAMMHHTAVKLDNDPMSNNRTGWKERWKKKKKRQDSIQNSNDSTAATHEDTSKHNPLSSERTIWKKKKKQKDIIQNSTDSMTTTHQDNTTLNYNGAFARTVEYHPGVSSDHSSEGSSSQSTAHTYILKHPQVHSNSKAQPNCEPTTSMHRSPPSSASGVPPDRQVISADSKTHISETAAGPSKQSSLQRTVTSFSSTQLSGIPSKYLAIDCEMVGAGPKGHISQLARCSIVSYDGDVVYDKFIKPGMPVTDFRTPWSGIRPRDLHGATPYAVARKEILKLVRGKVLIGHAIHNDLKALSYCHPRDMTRDTSRIPLLNAKAGFNEKQVVSLKRFTKALFNKDIQTGRKGHSSVEDAKATMELYKVVEVEWERTLASKAKESSKGK